MLAGRFVADIDDRADPLDGANWIGFFGRFGLTFAVISYPEGIPPSTYPRFRRCVQYCTGRGLATRHCAPLGFGSRLNLCIQAEQF